MCNNLNMCSLYTVHQNIYFHWYSPPAPLASSCTWRVFFVFFFSVFDFKVPANKTILLFHEDFWCYLSCYMYMSKTQSIRGKKRFKWIFWWKGPLLSYWQCHWYFTIYIFLYIFTSFCIIRTVFRGTTSYKKELYNI